MKVYSNMPNQGTRPQQSTGGGFSSEPKLGGGRYGTLFPYFVGGRKAQPADDYGCLYFLYVLYCLFHVACWIGLAVCDVRLWMKLQMWSLDGSLINDLALAVVWCTSISLVGLFLSLLYYWAFTYKKDTLFPALFVSVFTSALVVSLFFSSLLLIHYAVTAPTSSAHSFAEHAPPPSPHAPPAPPNMIGIKANYMEPITDFLILGLAFKAAVLSFLKINTEKAYGENLSFGDFEAVENKFAPTDVF